MTQAQQRNDGELLPVQALFSYDVMDAETREITQRLVNRIQQRNIAMAQAYIDNGKDLIAARERIPNGMWQSWLADNLNWSSTSATRMMRIARLFGDIQLAESQVTVSALHLLANQNIPDAVRQNVMELIKSNQITTEVDVFTYAREHFPQMSQVVSDRSIDPSKSSRRNRETVQYLAIQVAEMSFAVRNMQMALAQSYGVPLRADVADALQRLQIVSDSLIQSIPKESGHLGRQGNRITRQTSSRYVGVSFNKLKQKWTAKLRMNGKQVHIGYFDTEEDAARAYDAKARELYGDQARLNFPEETP